MSKVTHKPKTDPSGEELGQARQVRFQKSVEKEIETIATREGTDFPTVARMAARRGIEQLKQELGVSDKAA
jgi:hypothetical protein